MWISIHLYYKEPLYQFLKNSINPFVENSFKEQLLKQYFYINYWENGFHIRLRMKCDSIHSNKLILKSRRYFTNYFQLTDNDAIQKRIQFVVYEPEVIRYGGEECLKICEYHFQTSSKIISSLIQNTKTWNYNKALGTAVQLHYSFLLIVGMNEKMICQFCDIIYKSWRVKTKAYFKAGQPSITDSELDTLFHEGFIKNREQFIMNIKIITEHLNEIDSAWFKLWVKEVKIFYQKLTKIRFFNTTKKNDVIDMEELCNIYSSLIHMTNNRLGIMNKDEAFVTYFIKESIKEINHG